MGEHLAEHGNASSCNHFGPHGEWKIYLVTKNFNKSCQLATNRFKKKKKKKKGKMSKIYHSLEKLSMNYPLVNAYGTFISYIIVTI